MPEPQLTRRERQIMEIVHALGEADAHQVRAGLPEAPTYTAVRTMVRILCDKGHLTFRRVGKKHVYRTTATRRRVGRQAFRRVLEVYFEDSLQNALASHLTDPSADLSKADLGRLSELIEEAKRQED